MRNVVIYLYKYILFGFLFQELNLGFLGRVKGINVNYKKEKKNYSYFERNFIYVKFKVIILLDLLIILIFNVTFFFQLCKLFIKFYIEYLLYVGIMLGVKGIKKMNQTNFYFLGVEDMEVGIVYEVICQIVLSVVFYRGRGSFFWEYIQG